MNEPVRDVASWALVEIIDYVRDRIAAGDRAIRLLVADPSLGAERYCGEPVEPSVTKDDNAAASRHRPWRVWVELAQRLHLRLAVPGVRPPDCVELRLDVLPREPGGRAFESDGDDRREKYGTLSEFARVSKLEEPTFLLDFADAIERAMPGPQARVLDVGVNRGDELYLLERLVPGFASTGAFVGVDHCRSALEYARQGFANPRYQFVEADVHALEHLDLGPERFDLIVSIDTLQSPDIDDMKVLRHLVQARLAPGGSLVLGLPNCSYLDGELLHGARMRNFTQPELGLLIKRAAMYRKYLQQHRRRVFITGTHDILVTAVPVGRLKPPSTTSVAD